MKTRTKSALLLLGTLFIGILLGILTASTLQHRRAETIRKVHQHGGTTRLLEKVIAPEDSLQRAQILEIMHGVEENLQDARTECRQLIATRHDSLRTKLQAVLTAEQQERLDNWLQRDRHRSPRRDKRNQHRR